MPLSMFGQALQGYRASVVGLLGAPPHGSSVAPEGEHRPHARGSGFEPRVWPRAPCGTLSWRRQDGINRPTGWTLVHRGWQKRRGYMSDDALMAYLRDHLAGAAAAIELLKLLHEQHAGDPLGKFSEEILPDVEADRAVLADLTERVGGSSGVLKEATVWVGA